MAKISADEYFLCVGYTLMRLWAILYGNTLKGKLYLTTATTPSVRIPGRDIWTGGTWGRIYVANEYPTFARITLNVRQNLSVLMENTQILG